MPAVKHKTSNAKILHGFTGLEDYRRFVRDQYAGMNSNNRYEFDNQNNPNNILLRIDSRPDWYGENTTVDELLNPIRKFKNMDVVERVYNQVKNNLPESVRSKLKEKKLEFNAQGFGSFSMDRFMMSMYKRPAFWSIKKEEFVHPKDVYEKNDKYFLKEDNSDVEKQLKISTHNKKLYAYFPQLPNDSKSIEIVMTAGGNAKVTSSQMLYTGIAGIVLTELCERAGIKVRLNVFVGSNSTAGITGAIIPMKDFNAPVDKNIIALLTSDARVFRKEMFEGIIANYDAFGLNVPNGYGSLPDANAVGNVFDENKKLKDSVFQSEKVFYTSGIFTEYDAINKINEFVNLIKE